jgi:hypothetical protein
MIFTFSIKQYTRHKPLSTAGLFILEKENAAKTAALLNILFRVLFSLKIRRAFIKESRNTLFEISALP